ncbi:MAG: hypothetical protein H0X27_02305 [Caulobacteraceae bacterium]|nr:hypothetical protein [Caulobacteraceae bacterium]
MGRNTTVALASLAAVLTSACASTRAAPTLLVLAPAPGSPAPHRGMLYADCIGQAAALGRYDRDSDSGTHLLRFMCSGPSARALYVELGPWSAARHSEWVAGSRTWRSTGKVIRNLFGVDYCSTDGVRDYQCVIVLNVGSFLAG